MICIKCGNNIPEGTKICPYCGNVLEQNIASPIETPIVNNTPNELINNEQLGSISTEQQINLPVMNSEPQVPPISNGTEESPNSNKKKNIVPIIIAGICIFIVIIFAISKLSNKHDSSNNNANIIDNSQDNNKQDNQKNEELDNSALYDGNFSGNKLSKKEIIDSYNTNSYTKDDDFLMAIEDVYTVSGRGTVILGHVERGSLRINDEIDIVGLNKNIKTVVTGIEIPNKNIVDYAEIGDDIEIYVRRVERSQVARGQVASKINTIKDHRIFEANIYLYTPSEGGGNLSFKTDDKLKCYFKVFDVEGTIALPEEITSIDSGSSSLVKIALSSPVAMEVGTKFTIRENREVKGIGIIANIIE